ncbi:MAG: hypothetical protein GYA21_02035 [Myxococcales bacterium]|nr:hypothetical protein [Myxococcales bacterium]
MKPAPGRLPSLGFVAVILVYAAVAGFFAWGAATPPLDRIFRVTQALRGNDRMRLGADVRALLLRELRDHLALRQALLGEDGIGILSAHQGGWLATPTAWLLRFPDSERVRALRLEVHTAPEHLPFTLTVRGPTFRKRTTVSVPGAIEIALPPPGPEPEIIEVRLGGKRFAPDPSELAVRLSFEEGP